MTQPAYRRRKETPKSVLLADRAADWVIRVGGLGVIVAVLGILVFLVQAVVPLFTGGSVGEATRASVEGSTDALHRRVDEHGKLAIHVTRQGEVVPVHIATGRALAPARLDIGPEAPTAFAATLEGDDMVFGFADGSLRFAQVLLRTTVLRREDLPAGLASLGSDATDGSSAYVALPGNQHRRLGIEVRSEPPFKDEATSAIRAIDYRVGGPPERRTRAFAALDDRGIVRVSLAEAKLNILTRRVKFETVSAVLPRLPDGFEPRSLLISERADQCLIAAADGTLLRYDLRDYAAPRLAETTRLTPVGVGLSALAFLNGEQSLVVGRSDGSVGVFARLPVTDGRSADGRSLVEIHRLAPQAAPIVAIDASRRSKIFATLDASGGLWLRHPTSEQVLARLAAPGSTALALAPRDDGVLTVGPNGHAYWPLAMPHPETTLATIFGKVWYEGYAVPGFTWQSSSGNDSFEPKLSLVPLIFGTLKATLYALLFAVPVALLAAIYTSEFVHPRLRAAIKPTMEMMASLPSVVLGFIAALVLAPLIETWLSRLLAAMVVAPFALFLGAHLWQLLPLPTALRYGGLPKLVLIFGALLGGAGLGWVFGAPFEQVVFAGDVLAWAAGQRGSGAGVLALLLWPLAFLLVTAGAASREPWPRFGGPSGPGLNELVKWLVVCSVSALLAVALALALDSLGADPRNGLVGPYVQRNALIVGFAMGFAVIPIVYTIAEDALASVPEHLRAASLACGATPWQTALRVILPTAMSGVFAAVMVGMGRAVGETMIVVMAAGNTPILEWNIFSGLRALSANIAVELPEAVRDSTLYRMLFLAALVLFAMTFVVNTLAEAVRQRFRRRAAQL